MWNEIGDFDTIRHPERGRPAGRLRVPEHARAALVLLHGGRRSAALMRYAAAHFIAEGYAVLSVDLAEEAGNAEPSRALSPQADADFLANRIFAVSERLMHVEDLRWLPLGYFGTGVATAPALLAAAALRFPPSFSFPLPSQGHIFL